MTKRKRLRAGFVSYVVLFAVSPYVAFAEQQPADTSMRMISKNTTNQTALLHAVHAVNRQQQLSDSTLRQSATFNEAILTAPKVRMNAQAVKYVAQYLKQNDESLQKIKKRSAPYFRIIESVFQKYGLPTELKYLAVIESKLKTTAVSRVGAVGPWQFMPTTARELGLKVTSKYDERKHYYKSTTAAAKYLRDLYAEYGDWLLVIAAYNGGPGTVNKAIRNSGSRNFWKLQYHLPAETRAHVKKYIGAHYFFEEEGGETTLTKAESLAFAKAMNKFIAARKAALEAEATDAEAIKTMAIPADVALITAEKVVAKEPTEEIKAIKEK